MKPIQSNINHYIFCCQFQFELDLRREMAFNLLAIDPNYWIKETAQNWVQNGTSSDVTVTFVGYDNKLNNFQLSYYNTGNSSSIKKKCGIFRIK